MSSVTTSARPRSCCSGSPPPACGRWWWSTTWPPARPSAACAWPPTSPSPRSLRLARAMTLKNAAAGLPYGGGKAGICADPAMGRADKERLVRSFARAIGTLTDYIPGPDMGTDEACMGWIQDEIGRAVGLPAVLGGIPLDEIGATGLGLAACAEARPGGRLPAPGGCPGGGAGLRGGGRPRRPLPGRAGGGAGGRLRLGRGGGQPRRPGRGRAGGLQGRGRLGGAPSPAASRSPATTCWGWTATSGPGRPARCAARRQRRPGASQRSSWRAPTSRPPPRPSSCCTSAGCWWCPTSSPMPAG